MVTDNISVFRPMTPVYSDSGYVQPSSDNCLYQKVIDLTCVITSDLTDAMVQKNSFLANKEVKTFHIKSWLQDTPLPWDLKKDWYVLYQEVFGNQPVLDYTQHAYRIISIEQKKLTNNCCIFDLIAEKLEPRECQNIIRACGATVAIGGDIV